MLATVSPLAFFAILTAVLGIASKGVSSRLLTAALLCILPVLLFAQEVNEATPAPQANPALIQLSQAFQTWLNRNGAVEPFVATRLQRPADWAPDWSRTAIQARKTEYLQFQARLDAIAPDSLDTADQVDAALLGAAMERVHWQLEVLDRPSRDPGFYLDQSLGSLFNILLHSPQPSEMQLEEIIRRLHRFPALINSAKLNLDTVVPELATATINRIGNVNDMVEALGAALQAHVPANMTSDFEVGLRAMRQSLTSYQDWLRVSAPRFTQSSSVGAQKYRWYLGHVALAPQPPDTLAAEAELALAGIGATLAVSQHRSREMPAPSPFDQAGRLVQMAQISRSEIDAFLHNTRLLSPDDSRPPLELALLPPVLAPLAAAGEAVNFAADGATRYLSASRQQAGLVETMAWIEPRLLLSWDGTPGRWAQYHASSTNPRDLRQRAAGPAAGFGLALYFNEQVREAGLYTFSPASAELALNINRVAAALALADIRIALDGLNMDEAQALLETKGGLSAERARAEVERLIGYPGVAGAAFATYSQLLRFLADASLEEEEAFSLTAFNDSLLENANVPVTLQRWEYLGSEGHMKALEAQRGKQATVPE